jgi:opacity protein-like surface antigen
LWQKRRLVYLPRVKSALFASLLGLSLLGAGVARAAESDASSSDGEETGSAGEASAAEAEKSKKAEEEAEKEEADEDFGHMGQIGIRAGLVVGYRMIFRYDTSPYCTEYDPTKSNGDQRKFCGHSAPPALNLGLSFALLDFFEPYAWVRLGLSGEDETNTSPVKILGVGARIYTMSDSVFKIFVEPAVAYEFEGEADPPLTRFGGYEPNYKKDIVFHFAAGPQIDFHRNFGVYATGGITAGILRAIHSSLELDVGLQGRFP